MLRAEQKKRKLMLWLASIVSYYNTFFLELSSSLGLFNVWYYLSVPPHIPAYLFILGLHVIQLKPIVFWTFTVIDNKLSVLLWWTKPPWVSSSYENKFRACSHPATLMGTSEYIFSIISFFLHFSSGSYCFKSSQVSTESSTNTPANKAEEKVGDGKYSSHSLDEVAGMIRNTISAYDAKVSALAWWFCSSWRLWAQSNKLLW